MRRSKQHLSDTFVQGLTAKDSLIRIWDVALPGFGIRVTPQGVKSWIVQFSRRKVVDGRNVQVKVGATLGQYDSMKVKQARERADELRKIHTAGGDILAHISSEKQAETVSDIIEIWKKKHRALLKPSSQASYDSIIDNHIEPKLGRRTIKGLRHEDVDSFHTELQVDTPTQANRAIAIISKLIGIAETKGLRDNLRNPCLGIVKSQEVARSRKFQIQEFAALEKAMVSLVANGKLDDMVADLVRFLALSGLRRGEALGLKWSEVEVDRNRMSFNVHKTSRQGTKQVPKILPLNRQLKAILTRRKGNRPGEYVFSSAVTGGQYKGFGKCWTQILEHSALSDLHPHDFRRTFHSVCIDLGFTEAIGDILLGHSLGKVRDTYTQLGHDGSLGKASQDIANWIEAALQGRNPTAGKKVKSPSQGKGSKKPVTKKPASRTVRGKKPQ